MVLMTSDFSRLIVGKGVKLSKRRVYYFKLQPYNKNKNNKRYNFCSSIISVNLRCFLEIS